MQRRPASRRRLPYIIRKSPIHAKGAFATRAIRKGERIVEYRGERVPTDEGYERYPFDDDGEYHTFLFTVDDDTVIDAGRRGNSARFINHSCDPNCEAIIEEDPDDIDRVWIYARRNIRAGQELTYDYNFVLEEPHTAANKRLYACRCGSRNCRGTMLARKRR